MLNETQIIIDSINNYSVEFNLRFTKELSLRYKIHKEVKGPMVVSYNQLSRWDLSYFSSEYKTVQSSLYKLEALSSFITFSKNQKVPSGKKIIKYCGLESIEKDTGHFKLKEMGADLIKSNSTILEMDIIYYSKLRPYLNKCILSGSEMENSYASNELIGMKTLPGVLPEYIQYLMLSEIVKSQVSRLMIGARMPRISEKSIAKLNVIVPDIEIQRRIVYKIKKLNNELELKKNKLELVRKNSKNLLDNLIFKKEQDE